MKKEPDSKITLSLAVLLLALSAPQVTEASPVMTKIKKLVAKRPVFKNPFKKSLKSKIAKVKLKHDILDSPIKLSDKRIQKINPEKSAKNMKRAQKDAVTYRENVALHKAKAERLAERGRNHMTNESLSLRERAKHAKVDLLKAKRHEQQATRYQDKLNLSESTELLAKKQIKYRNQFLPDKATRRKATEDPVPHGGSPPGSIRRTPSNASQSGIARNSRSGSGSSRASQREPASVRHSSGYGSGGYSGGSPAAFRTDHRGSFSNGSMRGAPGGQPHYGNSTPTSAAQEEAHIHAQVKAERLAELRLKHPHHSEQRLNEAAHLHADNHMIQLRMDARPQPAAALPAPARAPALGRINPDLLRTGPIPPSGTLPHPIGAPGVPAAGLPPGPGHAPPHTVHLDPVPPPVRRDQKPPALASAAANGGIHAPANLPPIPNEQGVHAEAKAKRLAELKADLPKESEYIHNKLAQEHADELIAHKRVDQHLLNNRNTEAEHGRIIENQSAQAHLDHLARFPSAPIGGFPQGRPTLNGHGAAPAPPRPPTSQAAQTAGLQSGAGVSHANISPTATTSGAAGGTLASSAGPGASGAIQAAPVRNVPYRHNDPIWHPRDPDLPHPELVGKFETHMNTSNAGRSAPDATRANAIESFRTQLREHERQRLLGNGHQEHTMTEYLDTVTAIRIEALWKGGHIPDHLLPSGHTAPIRPTAAATALQAANSGGATAAAAAHMLPAGAAPLQRQSTIKLRENVESESRLLAEHYRDLTSAREEVHRLGQVRPSEKHSQEQINRDKQEAEKNLHAVERRDNHLEGYASADRALTQHLQEKAKKNNPVPLTSPAISTAPTAAAAVNLSAHSSGLSPAGAAPASAVSSPILPAPVSVQHGAGVGHAPPTTTSTAAAPRTTPASAVLHPQASFNTAPAHAPAPAAASGGSARAQAVLSVPHSPSTPAAPSAGRGAAAVAADVAAVHRPAVGLGSAPHRPTSTTESSVAASAIAPPAVAATTLHPKPAHPAPSASGSSAIGAGGHPGGASAPHSNTDVAPHRDTDSVGYRAALAAGAATTKGLTPAQNRQFRQLESIRPQRNSLADEYLEMPAATTGPGAASGSKYTHGSVNIQSPGASNRHAGASGAGVAPAQPAMTGSQAAAKAVAAATAGGTAAVAATTTAGVKRGLHAAPFPPPARYDTMASDYSKHIQSGGTKEDFLRKLQTEQEAKIRGQYNLAPGRSLGKDSLGDARRYAEDDMRELEQHMARSRAKD